VLVAGGPLLAKKVHLLKLKRDAMNAPIKIVKRDARTVPEVTEVSSAGTNERLTTEKIVKSWIRESRDRRQALVTQLRAAIRRREITGAARG
jgi:hypothetical protein